MARGQYEIPSTARSKPTYGPVRPPAYASRTTLTITAPSTIQRRAQATLVIVSLDGLDDDAAHTSTLRARIKPDLVIEEVKSANAALEAFSRRPHAIFVSQATLDDSSNFFINRAAAQYVDRYGGILITDPLQLPPALARRDQVYGEGNTFASSESPQRAVDSNPKHTSTVRTVMLGRTMS